MCTLQYKILKCLPRSSQKPRSEFQVSKRPWTCGTWKDVVVGNVNGFPDQESCAAAPDGCATTEGGVVVAGGVQPGGRQDGGGPQAASHGGHLHVHSEGCRRK